jgi:Gas vesicle protein
VGKVLHSRRVAGGIDLALPVGMKTRKAIVRTPGDVMEVLDRVLDRGIVIDVWLRVSLVGLQLVDVDARVVVASIKTYVRHGDAVAGHDTVAQPPSPGIPAKRPAARTRRPRRPRPRVMLRCPSGCTFLRAARNTRQVACPSERGRACAVTAV